MTWRARWLCLFAVIGLFLGLARGQQMLSLLSLSVLVWICIEWAAFLWRMSREPFRIRVTRRVNGSSETGRFLWTGRTVDIETTLTMTRGDLHGVVIARDIVPENLEAFLVDPSEGQPAEYVVGSPCSEFVIRYQGKPRSAGQVFLPGVRLTFQDPQGLFRSERFISCAQTFRVLPGYAVARNSSTLVKRINALPTHGIHRLQRSGMGSELLELREYVDGDPPKSIAWKVSARRDKLMTRQYESEVPVRLQLFVDGSMGTRIGGFGYRLLDQILFVASTVARTAISNGDPVGAVMFDERRTVRVPAAAGERGFYRLLEALSGFSTNPAPLPQRLSALMLNAAQEVCLERFPELLERSANLVPFTWFPILPWSRRRFQLRCRLAGALAEIYQVSVETQVQLIHDDYLMSVYVQHFFNQSGFSWMEPFVLRRGRGANDALPRIEQIAAAITKAVAYARDNEVFVIFADLMNCSRTIAHLLPAVKLALAKHHRVAFVCPSPTFLRPTKASTIPEGNTTEELLLAAEQMSLAEESALLKRTLARIGASFSVSGEEHAIHMILNQMDLARSGRMGVRA